MTWQIGMFCNTVIAGAYLLIAFAIVVPLAKSNQLKSNPLGSATAAIFFTCACTTAPTRCTWRCRRSAWPTSAAWPCAPPGAGR